jgi:SAM-dependent methyltransferase
MHECRGCQKSDSLSLVHPFSAPIGDFLEAEYLDALKLKPIEMPLFACLSCGLLQLIPTWDVASIYVDYKYRTKTTKNLVTFYENLAKTLCKEKGLTTGDLIVDVGCGDGTLMESFIELGVDCIGIDPNSSNLIENIKLRESSINNYFEQLDVATLTKIKSHKPSLVFVNFTLANVHLLDQFLDNLFIIGTLDTEYIIITGDHTSQFHNLMFDYVSHDHLSYFSDRSLRYLLAKKHFEVQGVTKLPFRGGSLMLRFTKKRFKFSDSQNNLAENDPLIMDEIESFKKSLKELELAKDKLKSIMNSKTGNPKFVGIGASTSTVYLCELLDIATKELLNFVLDDDPAKQGRFFPNSGIPIAPLSLISELNSIPILLAWQHTNVLMERLQVLGYYGEVIIPLPTPKTLLLTNFVSQ